MEEAAGRGVEQARAVARLQTDPTPGKHRTCRA